MPKKNQPDPGGQHIRLYATIVDSPAWRALTWFERSLYVAIRRSLHSYNNGDITATLSVLRHQGISSSASLAKGLRALMTVGLIDVTFRGGIANGAKSCSRYRFTDQPVNEDARKGLKQTPPTRDWQRFTSIAQAESAIREAHLAAKRPRLPKSTGSFTERVGPVH